MPSTRARQKEEEGEAGQTQPSRQRGQQQSPNTSTVTENTFYIEQILPSPVGSEDSSNHRIHALPQERDSVVAVQTLQIGIQEHVAVLHQHPHLMHHQRPQHPPHAPFWVTNEGWLATTLLRVMPCSIAIIIPSAPARRGATSGASRPSISLSPCRPTPRPAFTVGVRADSFASEHP
jgi:hypothetical protein